MRRERATTAQVRAMVHPIRWRIVEVLDRHGPLTATKVGELLDLSSGVTSYHLRVLAEADVIEEAPELAKGRERWWKAPELRPYIPTDASTADERAFLGAARLFHLERDEEALHRFMLGLDRVSPEWQSAAFTGSWVVELTADEVFELGMRFFQLIDEVRAEQRGSDRPAEAREVVVTLRALPWLSQGGDHP
jgi:DNA-binding transcriptional ArsR family regulator